MTRHSEGAARNGGPPIQSPALANRTLRRRVAARLRTCDSVDAVRRVRQQWALMDGDEALAFVARHAGAWDRDMVDALTEVRNPAIWERALANPALGPTFAVRLLERIARDDPALGRDVDPLFATGHAVGFVTPDGPVAVALRGRLAPAVAFAREHAASIAAGSTASWKMLSSGPWWGVVSTAVRVFLTLEGARESDLAACREALAPYLVSFASAERLLVKAWARAEPSAFAGWFRTLDAGSPLGTDALYAASPAHLAAFTPDDLASYLAHPSPRVRLHALRLLGSVGVGEPAMGPAAAVR